MPEPAEWTADDLIEALRRCHRTDAPIYFKYGGHDLYLLDVHTEGGEVQLAFQRPPEGLDVED